MIIREELGSLQDYEKMELSIPLERMVELHTQMLEEIGTDEDALELYEELVKQANRYVQFRSNWILWSREEKMEHDASRTSCHDSLIVKFNQLAKFLQMIGKETQWRKELGFIEDDPYNRKRIGDFACYIIFMNSICAR